jgi:copper chaperone
MDENMETMTYEIPAISCSHCTHTIELEVGELPGVSAVTADLGAKRVTVTFSPPADDASIRALLAEIEYPAAGPA